MKILALDSSSAPASVAVTENETLIGEFTLNIGRTHSEKLLPLIDEILDSTDLCISDIDAFAISIGPGSFTGIRIGMSAAKIMAQTAKKPLIGVKTLETLAANVCAFNGYIFPVIDARNRNFYNALYACSGGTLTEIAESSAVHIESYCRKINELDKPTLICGEYMKYKEEISSLLKDKNDIYFAAPHLTLQRAASCAALAYKQYVNGQITMPEEVMPLYVRESQAEQAKKRGNCD